MHSMVLKDQDEFYKACFDSMQVGILVYNTDKTILISNNAIARIFGYSKNELQSKKISILFKNTFIIDNYIKDSTNKKFTTALKAVGIQKNGVEIPVKVVFDKIRYNSQIYYKFLISDLSLRKNKEHKIINLTSKLEEEIKLRNEELEQAIDDLKTSFKNEKELDKLLRGNLQNYSNSKNTLQQNIDSILLNKKIYSYTKGETIYCKGNLSNHIFLIKNGIVKTYKINNQGKEFITKFYTNNQYFGYASFIKQLPHFENSKAISNVKLYKINKNEIAAIIDKNPSAISDFLVYLANDLVEIKEQLPLLAYASVRKKTARTLLNLMAKNPLKFEGKIDVSRSDLANTIGIASETLIRTLHDFKNEKLIEEQNKKIKIINQHKLSKIQ